jgi:hypothetical protein
MLDQIGQRRVDLRLGNHLIVVQDEDKALPTLGKEIDKCAQNILERWSLRRLQGCQEWGKESSGSVNDRWEQKLKGRERIAQRGREKKKDAKIRKKAQEDVRELMNQFSSW